MTKFRDTPNTRSIPWNQRNPWRKVLQTTRFMPGTARRLVSRNPGSDADFTLDQIDHTLILRSYSAASDSILPSLSDELQKLPRLQSLLVENDFSWRAQRGLALFSSCLFGADQKKDLTFQEGSFRYLFSDWAEDPDFFDAWVVRRSISQDLAAPKKILLFGDVKSILPVPDPSQSEETVIRKNQFRDLIGICQTLRESQKSFDIIFADLTLAPYSATTLFHFLQAVRAQLTPITGQIFLKVKKKDHIMIQLKNINKSKNKTSMSATWLKARRRDLTHLYKANAPHFVRIVEKSLA